MLYVVVSLLFYPLILSLTRLRSAKKKRHSRIVVIQTAKIGDLICSTPVFREIKKHYPGAELTVVTSTVAREILQNNPRVDRVIAIDKRAYRGVSGKIRLARLFLKENFDIALCLNPNVLYAVTLFWGLVPKRIGLVSNFSGLTYRLAVLLFNRVYSHHPGKLVVRHYLEMLETLGIKAENPAREVFVSPEGERKAEALLRGRYRPLVGVAVSCRNKLKKLEVSKLREIVDFIVTRLRATPVLIGSASEKALAESILEGVRNKEKVLNCVGRFSLEELPSLIRRLKLFIGVDTGITYMADALNIPIVTIAGPVNTREQRPLGDRVIILQRRDLSCVPCSFVFKTNRHCPHGTRACLRDLSAEEICATIERLYQSL